VRKSSAYPAVKPYKSAADHIFAFNETNFRRRGSKGVGPLQTAIPLPATPR
jgi:hypothetical protein